MKSSYDNFKESKYKTRSFDDMHDDLTEYLSLFRSYPDLFIDFILPENSTFKLYFYQRMILRGMFRYRRSFFTLTRGSSKSFTEILGKYIECILYPNIRIMITAPQKQMASQIAQQNIESIWNFMPLLRGEVRKVSFEKDYTRLTFHNNAILDVVANSESSRGLRREGLAVEEIIHERFNEDNFNEVILPIMANNRVASCGGDDPYEKHKKIAIVTTAGTKQSFAFGMHEEYRTAMKNDEDAFVLGASYELATSFGLLSLDYINDLKESPNFNPMSFTREYGSVWSGSSEDSLVDLETFRQSRVLTEAEDKAVDKNAEYVLTYDVARSEGNLNAQSALVVIKIKEKGDGTYTKHVVNTYTFEGSHFREQALFLKQKVNDFGARILVVDANGLGQGLVDQLILEIDTNPAYEVVNDERYNKFKTSNSIPMVFAVKSQSKDTREADMNNLFYRWVGNNHVKFLDSESQARGRFDKNNRSSEEEKYIRPFTQTDFLQEEIMNLEYRQNGNNTTIKQISKSIQKDRFSALKYGLFWIHLEEKKNQARKNDIVGDISQFFMGRKVGRHLKGRR